MTPHGEESFSTRVSHHTSIWTEYTVPAYPVYCDDTWGADHTDPGWDERDDPDRQPQPPRNAPRMSIRPDRRPES